MKTENNKECRGVVEIFYDHQPSSPSVAATETVLGVGDAAERRS